MHRFLNLAAALLLPLAGFAGPSPDEADDLVQYIDGLHERGLHDMVAREADDFLDEHPRHAQVNRVRYRLGNALFELGRQDDALPHFRRLAQSGGFDYRAECALRLGQCALELDDLDEAAQAFELTRSLDADYLHVPATYLLAEVHFRAGRYGEAEPLFDDVLRKDSDGDYSQDARSSLAWCAFRLGKHDLAVQRAQQLLDRRPPQELAQEMQFVQGEAHLEAGRSNEARAAYRKVQGGAFADAALRGLGFAESARGDNAAAAQAFQRVVNEHSGSRFAKESRLQSGIHLLQAGDAEGAAQTLAHRDLGTDPETLYWRARANAALGRHQDALQQLDRALSGRPDEELAPHIHTARGDALTALGQGKIAAAAYERAGSLAALHAAAVTRLNAGDARDALRLVTPLLEREDADASVALTHAEALFALKRYTEARVSFQKARATDDKDLRRRVDARLAWCAYLADEHGEAARAFDALARSAPGTAEGIEALFMAGRSHRINGVDDSAVRSWKAYVALTPHAARRDEALMGLAELSAPATQRTWLDKLAADHPHSPHVPGALFALAEADSQGGKLAAAEKRYAELVAKHPEHESAPSARYGLAFCLVERGAVNEAAEALQPLTTKPRSNSARNASRAQSVDPALRLAALELLVWCRHEQGDPQGAEAAWRQLAAEGVDGERLASAARMVAGAWRSADRPDRALDILDQVGTRPGAGPEALVEGAWIALDEGQPDVAAERLDLALGQDANSAAVAEACFFLAEAFFAKGDDARATPYYRAAAAAEGSTLADEALYKQGFAHLRSAEPQPAAACFGALVKRFPKSELVGESLFLEGEAWYRMERYAEAVQPLQRLVQEHPRHQVLPKARFRLGLALAQSGRCAEAEGVLARLAQQSPDFPNIAEAELWRGRCLAEQLQERAALSAFQRVIELDKGLLAAQARLGLGHMQLNAGDTEDALSEFLKVALLYSHSEEVAEALFMAGQCLEEMGQPDTAAERYRELLASHPDTAFAPRARSRLSAL